MRWATVSSLALRTRLRATKISPGTNAPWQSTWTLGKVMPWLLWIAMANDIMRGVGEGYLTTSSIVLCLLSNWKKWWYDMHIICLRSWEQTFTQSSYDAIICPPEPLTNFFDRFTVRMTGAPTFKRSFLGAFTDLRILYDMLGPFSLIYTFTPGRDWSLKLL